MKLYKARWKDNGEIFRAVIYDEIMYPVGDLPGVFKMLDDIDRGPRTVLLCLMLGTALNAHPASDADFDELIWDVRDATL